MGAEIMVKGPFYKTALPALDIIIEEHCYRKTQQDREFRNHEFKPVTGKESRPADSRRQGNAEQREKNNLPGLADNSCAKTRKNGNGSQYKDKDPKRWKPDIILMQEVIDYRGLNLGPGIDGRKRGGRVLPGSGGRGRLHLLRLRVRRGCAPGGAGRRLRSHRALL